MIRRIMFLTDRLPNAKVIEIRCTPVLADCHATPLPTSGARAQSTHFSEL
jgi:hypothetical protein